MKLAPADVPVLHRDGHLIVVAKPAGIATTAPEGGPSLFALVKELDWRAPQLHPLSRLDTQVTGIVAFARTTRANEVAIEARRAGTMTRRYLGISAQLPSPASGHWRWSIALDPADPKKRIALAPGEPGMGVKESSTRYAVRAEAGPLAALDLWPETGRTHQLRVHASRAQCPLFGDVAYGGAKRITLPNGRVLTAQRVLLHCTSLRMPHVDGSSFELDLGAPEDLLAVWRSAGGDSQGLSPRA
jgi:23S rRNA-/tRNA-specific pseudouridylate synthase